MANFDPNNPAELAAALEILNAPMGNVTNFDEYQATFQARLDQLGLVDLPLTDPKESGAVFGTTIISEEALKLLASPEEQDRIQEVIKVAGENPIISPTVELTPMSEEDTAALFAEADPAPAELQPTGIAYDADGNLLPGWELDENNNPTYVGNDPLAEIPEDIADEEFYIPEEEFIENESPEAIDPSQGPAYDDEGNLMPGWSLDENNDPVWIGGDYIEPTLEGTGQSEPETPSTPVDLSQADLAAHGPAYDDEGNLLPGWTTDEEGNPRWVGGDFVEPATQASADASREENAARIKAATEDAQKKATEQDIANFEQAADWRVRLSLAPKANYLYNAQNAGILAPLKATKGVIFPYAPQIQVAYNANYESSDITHTNYKFYQYKNSEVGQIQISADFTAQDTEEANYMLAVIHFFKSVTKMFYGQDNNPPNGVPPPLCYLSGYGAYQFDNHPLVISNFSYSLPNDVDYIRAAAVTQSAGVNLAAYQNKVNTYIPSLLRLFSSGLNPGGVQSQPNFTSLSNKEATYVPTKLSMQLTCIPVVTRRDVSNNFSVEKYATGSLLRGSRRQGGGIW